MGSGAQSLGDSGATRLTAECLLRHEALMGQAGGKSQGEGDQMEEGEETGDGGVMSASTVKTFATDFRLKEHCALLFTTIILFLYVFVQTANVI